MNPFSRLAHALWELKHVQYERDIVRWAGFTKYVIYRKRGASDSAHAYTLKYTKVVYAWDQYQWLYIRSILILSQVQCTSGVSQQQLAELAIVSH